uniref:Uncharacterized protein n=1 Tax=Fusarium oxysporum (strain Fo5176) TaxID=660025 RepID=A0A0D2Y7Q3_FUSOF
MGREIIWISARARAHEGILQVLSIGQITPIEERGHVEEEIALCLWRAAEIKCTVDRDSCTGMTSTMVRLEQALRQAQAQITACAEPTDGDTSAVCLINRERLIIQSGQI